MTKFYCPRNWTAQQRLDHYTDKTNSCWLWTGGRNDKGYGFLNIRPRGAQLAHRLVWELKYGEIPSGRLICHHCDTPTCVNPDHLFLGTDADNAADKIRKGRARPPRGEAHPHAKLTAQDIIAIRHASGRQVDIGATYGISQRCVSMIKRRESWRHVG